MVHLEDLEWIGKKHSETKDTKWASWQSLDALDEVSGKVTSDVGVYIIRTSISFRRLKGSSRILYIGEGQLYERLDAIDTLNGRHTARDRFWRYFREFPAAKLDFAYLAEEDGQTQKKLSKAQAKQLEDWLLEDYEENHLELPPFNHQK